MRAEKEKDTPAKIKTEVKFKPENSVKRQRSEVVNLDDSDGEDVSIVAVNTKRVKTAGSQRRSSRPYRGVSLCPTDPRYPAQAVHPTRKAFEDGIAKEWNGSRPARAAATFARFSLLLYPASYLY
jgi:hypothetical protein